MLVIVIVVITIIINSIFIVNFVVIFLFRFVYQVTGLSNPDIVTVLLQIKFVNTKPV